MDHNGTNALGARDWLTAWLCAVGDFEGCHSEN